MSFQSILAAVAPVILILVLGFAAGKHRSFDQDQSRGLSKLALTYALPAALFLAMAHFDRSLLMRQGPIVVVMTLGYCGFFLVCYAILRARLDALRAALLGYTLSSTAAPIYGLTVLTPLFGHEVAAGIVGLAALVTNLGQVSVAIFLLQSAEGKPGARPSLFASLGRCAANPLVWAPLLGAAFALAGWSLDSVAAAALQPLAASASGVAIFACGLALAAYPLRLGSRTAILGSLVCVIVQPAVFFLLIKGFGLTGPMAEAAFVASAMPTSTPSVLFAQQYGAYEAEIAAIMLVTTAGIAVTLPLSLWIGALL